MIDVDALIKTAMKSREKAALETYKLLKAKILEFKTAKNAKEYNDAEEVNLIRKMIEERTNTAEIYKNNNRPELARAELEQAEILQELMPKVPSEDELRDYLTKRYNGGIEQKQMGNVVRELKQLFLGADGKTIANLVKGFVVKGE